ncbi:unnamed protein product [Phytophthora fragariaefolia]|uniref:Unnamed protein product n=1 Tax=Phytophthora fragariaefolia TaxID=1490495 RepID=A0A9W7D5A3_9STRA|nr:unnamed protein product [Phytophthora fragariaefolia]
MGQRPSSGSGLHLQQQLAQCALVCVSRLSKRDAPASTKQVAICIMDAVPPGLGSRSNRTQKSPGAHAGDGRFNSLLARYVLID